MPNFFSFSQQEVSIAVVIFNLVFATFLSLAIAYVHKKTHTGLSYSYSFFTTLVLIGIIASVVLMVVQNNIYGALGLLGAFAFIRFRTIIKETRDIAFLFLSLAEGVAVGLNQYAVALLSTAAISLVAYLLFRFNLGYFTQNNYILLLNSTSPIEQDAFTNRLRENKISVMLLNSKKRQDQMFEYTFRVTGKDVTLLHDTINEISSLYSIKEFDIISGKESIEY
ncbi:MAG: DUF4956 domain-containing protein [Candidatus Spechtbacteria bacterium]|nr:DUF4956 domain-containing protein [Candidatus Spechtbacteria bacterium]